MLDQTYIEEIRSKNSNNNLTRNQGNIIIILLSLILISLILICFFVFDSRELNSLILEQLK